MANHDSNLYINWKDMKKLTQAQEYAYTMLKKGNRIYYNITGSDPVYNKDGKLITRICNIGTMANLIQNGLVEVIDYEYVLKG